MRLMKKLATLATLLTSPPPADVDFECIDVSLRNLFIHVLREQQRDVDVDAFAQHLANRRNSRRRVPGILIITFSRATAFHKPPRFVDSALGVVGEIRRDFQAHVSVAPLRAVVHRASAGRRQS